MNGSFEYYTGNRLNRYISDKAINNAAAAVKQTRGLSPARAARGCAVACRNGIARMAGRRQYCQLLAIGAISAPHSMSFAHFVIG